MKKVLCLSAVLVFCFSASCWSAPILTADDFSPIVQANTEQERQELSTVHTPEGVKTEVDPTLNKPVTTATTTQDAVNSVMQRFYADGGEGCESIRLPDGELGLVAVGVGTYGSDVKNIVAQRREQQLAYYIAFLQAKRLMARYFEGASIEQLSMFVHEESSTDNADTSTSATTDKSNLDIKSATSAVLKGYVTYDVRDDFENGTVYVTLVSTPRTQGRYSRPTSTTQIAETLNEGINKILAEIQSGVVPPVGGRIVNVPETGEIAFVGFGSEVVRPADNRKAKADNRTTARRRASLRAEASLCGIIRGDTVTTSDSDEVGATNSYTSGGKNFDLSDPIDDLTSDSEKAEAQETAQGFRSDDSYKQVIQSAIKGIIPPGVSPRAWLDKEGAFAYAVAVYIPSVTKKAAQMNQDMKDSQIVQSYEVRRNSPSIPVSQDKNNQEVKINTQKHQDSGTLQPGVSGTIDQPL